MQLFYEPQIEQNHFLNSIDSQHCIKVLRHQVGDIINVMDGCGAWFECEITEANHKKCGIKILNKRLEEKRPFHIHMVVAPTKNIDRFEWFLEKATEIGIDEITPILCDHSERKVIKEERLEKVIITAMKQSLKAYKPILNPLTKMEDFVKSHVQNDDCYIAHCYDTPKELLKNIYPSQSNATILIGPEGDFSEKEVALALSNGFKAISLGEARLRTETAALIACATINIGNL